MGYGFPVLQTSTFGSSETYCGFMQFFLFIFVLWICCVCRVQKKNSSLSAPVLGQAKKNYLQLFENCCIFLLATTCQLTTRRGPREVASIRHTNTNDKNGRNGTVEGRSRFFSFRTLRMTVMLPMGITTLCLAGADLEQLMATRNPARKPPWDA